MLRVSTVPQVGYPLGSAVFEDVLPSRTQRQAGQAQPRREWWRWAGFCFPTAILLWPGRRLSAERRLATA